MTGEPPDRPGQPPSLRDLGEDRLVLSVMSRFGVAPPWLQVPAGDDAAVLDLAAAGSAGVTGSVVAATDTMVEGLDFRRDWSSGVDVGVKVAAQNLADLAAMGAVPLSLLVSLAAPGDLPACWATDLADGLALECARAGAHVVGGDVSAAPLVVVTGAALGLLNGLPPVLRSGARPGDVLAIAGRTGPSAAGLALFEAGWPSDRTVLPGLDPAAAGRMLAAHRRPQPPFPDGPSAAVAGATAMIDISDGLVRDAGRVARASGVVLDLDPQLLYPQVLDPQVLDPQVLDPQVLDPRGLPPDGDLIAVAAALGVDPLGWVLSGGEDHALLACFPAAATLPAGFRVIGRVRAAGAAGPSGLSGLSGPSEWPGGTAVLVGGRPWSGDPGWQHFR